ncbi:MAG: hypothetical protein F2589_04660 [Actinobacteria bacterium]|uniref:Unannotated protein n=1 Tax=freshwater metagenome TaxID=449393 RepID=A0A6J6HXL9_9ZZZZ|nr:hypothetical protein [Actinomycetota bacterium]
MEILRFNEAESNTPKRKKSSRGMIALGLVATLFGVGSALASSTISINSGDPINVGQGVSLVTACDEDNSIDIRFGTALKGKIEILDPEEDDLSAGDKAAGKIKGKPVFFTNNIELSKVDGRENDEATGFGCGTQYFSLQVYYNPSKGVDEIIKPYTCGQLGLRGGDNPGTDDNVYGGISDVTCTTPGTIKFKVDTTGSLNSTLTLPLGKQKNENTILDKALDISYFTLVSSNS